MKSVSLTQKNLLALSFCEELSLKKKEALLDAVDDPSRLYACKKEVNAILADKASEFFDICDDIDNVLKRLEREGVDFVTYLDDNYPQSLREIDGLPTVLFYKGDLSALKSDCIAVVGTRRPSRYGSKVAQEFTRAFSNAGLTVVSGLARGVDSVAHNECVLLGHPTVAVMGCGLDSCYPAEHRGLVDSIIQNGGLVLSEYPLGAKPLQYHFPERNRIISGLSRAVFLAEAASKSGSLITMRIAIEQGRDIFAVPGNIYAAECEGSNRLLRDMPHALAICPDDVLNALHIVREEAVPQAVELDFTENAIVEALKNGEKHFEELLALTDLSVGELTNILFNLEMNGVVENIGGNYYDLA